MEAITRLNKDTNCYKAVDFLDKYITDWYKKADILKYIKQDKTSVPSASVIIYSKFHNQIWLIGDCSALYDGKLIENYLEIDKLHSDIRSKIINYLLQTGVSEDEILKRKVDENKFFEDFSKR